MSFNHVGGLDHVVVMVGDLNQAAADWGALGFTVSPRGVHSAHVGAANHTVVLENDYIELLAVLRDTQQNAPSRDFLERRGGGIERIALVTDDAAAAAEELRSAGIAASGPFAFGRPVPILGGGEVEANFRIARWPIDAAPGGLRLFVCEHLTREAVWRPELMDHVNTATSLRRILVASPTPRVDANKLAHLIGSTVVDNGHDIYVVPTGDQRAALVFSPRTSIAARYSGVQATDLPERGAAAAVIAVRDLARTADALGSTASTVNGALFVPPHRASGILLVFEEV